MLKKVLLAGAILISAPVLAQTQSPADPVAPSPTAPAANAQQVASVVDSQFPNYDKDGDGTLNAAEFATWMTALRTASEPKATTDAATLAKWADAAFTQADTDQSKSVSKVELIGFLSKGQG